MKTKQIEAKELKGIGGWLIVLILVLIISVVILSISIVNMTAYDSGATIFLSIILLFLIIYGLILVFQEKKKAPKFIIFVLWFNFIFALLIYLAIGKGEIELVLSLFSATLWTFYLRLSKRVKNTFVN